MATRFVNKKTRSFYFDDANGTEQSYVLIFGDEVNTLTGTASKGAEYSRVSVRGRTGQ